MARQAMKRGLPLLLLAVACGSRTATPSGTGTTGPMSEALSWVGCGPTDGPAIVVLIAEGQAACADRAALQAGDHLELEIWSGAFPSAGQTVTLQGNEGSASICRAGACAPLVGATVTSNGNDGTGWTATLTYTDAGVTKKTSFHTTECVVQPIMCG